MAVSFFWFRRDLRLEDNCGLFHALQSGDSIIPVFIFDENILSELPKDDARVTFIYDNLARIHAKLASYGSSLLVMHGNPLLVWKELSEKYAISSVFTNKDYEPYGIARDREIGQLFAEKNIAFHRYKDHVIFEEGEILKNDGKPYTVYTPYKNKWLEKAKTISIQPFDFQPHDQLFKAQFPFPELEKIGFVRSSISVKPFSLEVSRDYADTRDFPAKNGTSNLSPHLRFGTVGIRQIVSSVPQTDATFLSELIWREFFMQILYHFPEAVNQNFKPQYNGVVWRNNTEDFEKWCAGKTGYPLVDAGMRELNATGYMHNRVRMITAGFLCKHLLIDWRWGEAYFAKKLLDFELSSNNGNWQWSAGTGCDAAPYFRIFNPTEQIRKFDSQLEYIRKWIPEFDSLEYPVPMVDHKFARERALKVYQEGLGR
jgi:deoxyribodipyrimidine photo-lyase